MLNSDEEKNGKEHEDSMSALMLKARTILVNGEVNQELAQKVISQLIILDADSDDPIKVIVTSPGGHVDSGYAIHDMLKFIKSPVITIGAGWVASIAVPIFFGAPKEHRYTLPGTRFLIHQPSGGAGGQAADIRIEAQEIIKIRKRINEMISEETGQDVEKVASDSERNFWMTAEEAVEYGIATKIVTSSEDV